MMKKLHNPHPIELHVGKQLRKRRKLLGLSQKQVSEAFTSPITAQQLQKYEKGVNRIGCSRLYELSLILHVSPLYFFDGSYQNKPKS